MSARSEPGPWTWPVTMGWEDVCTGLSPVGTRGDLVGYTRRLWAWRHFIWEDARARALASQRGTVLGNTWLVVRPMLDASVFFVVFGLLLDTSSGIDNYVAYLIIGVTLFQPMQRAVTAGSQVMVSGRNLLRSFSFPRAALPLSFTVRGAIDLLPPLAAVAVLIILLPPHAAPGWTWLLTVPVFVLQQALCLGLTLVAACLTTALPDLRNLWGFATRFWYFASGVFFSFETILGSSQALALVELNPGYLVLRLYRTCLLDGQVPSLRLWALLAVWSLGLSAVGYVLFWWREESYGRER
ncbi:ABC transporter permease [Actinomyces howellii]|uniref:ABC-2 type transporter n=1 Tax=Actinomyces howellii TaxID=52771 RepID=A0A3S4RCL8_9ACTO|nr:ABC transporter permease [Actinomyces howellii]VEG30138.1 ABC-2 type transporter [Actinomyces howellii]